NDLMKGGGRMNHEEVFDITIIGGGPAGMFTAFYAGMRQASVKILESLPQLGGQLAALYPDKYVYDVAGFPKIKAQDLVDRLIEKMNQLERKVCLNEIVTEIIKEDEKFKIKTYSQSNYAKTSIITDGNGAFIPRTMKFEKESKFETVNLHYGIKNINDFR